MSLRDNFKVGDRVKPSRRGLRANLWRANRAVRTGGIPGGGTVTAKSHSALCVNVTWDGRKTSSSYHKDFISRARAATDHEAGPSGGK